MGHLRRDLHLWTLPEMSLSGHGPLRCRGGPGSRSGMTPLASPHHTTSSPGAPSASVHVRHPAPAPTPAPCPPGADDDVPSWPWLTSLLCSRHPTDKATAHVITRVIVKPLVSGPKPGMKRAVVGRFRSVGSGRFRSSAREALLVLVRVVAAGLAVRGLWGTFARAGDAGSDAGSDAKGEGVAARGGPGPGEDLERPVRGSHLRGGCGGGCVRGDGVAGAARDARSGCWLPCGVWEHTR